MVNLPRRKKQVEVEIPDEDVTITVRTLTQAEYSEAVGDAMAEMAGEVDEVEVPPLGKLISSVVQFAHKKIVHADGVEVEGEDFNPQDDEHIDALPGDWMLMVADRLAREAQVSEEMGKDSTEPDVPSTGATTPDVPSPAGSGAS